MNIIKTVHVILIFLLSCTAVADDVLFNRNSVGEIKRITKLPVNGLMMVETDKLTYFLSENSRYAFIGEMIDVWSNRKITDSVSLGDADKIPLQYFSAAGIDFNEIATVSYGKGQKDVVIFATPLSDASNKTIQLIKTLEQEYTFKVVLLPVDDENTSLIRKIVCSNSTDDAKEILRTRRFSNLPEELKCNDDKLAKSVITAKVLGLTKVPLIIAPNGRISRGLPESLVTFLHENS